MLENYVLEDCGYKYNTCQRNQCQKYSLQLLMSDLWLSVIDSNNVTHVKKTKAPN